MRWRFTAGLALLVGAFGTGCPEIYGKNGYLDDAMEKDIKEQQKEREQEFLRKPPECLGDQPPEWHCDKSSDECYWKCR